jgi:spore coat protein U-like protein
MNVKLIHALAAGMLLSAASLSQAQTATGEMSVGARVTQNCTLSADYLDFGNLSVLGVNNASALVTLVCNGTSTVTTILVGMGANADPATQRNMVADTNLLPYTLTVLEAGGADIAAEGAVTLVRVGTTNTYTTTLYGQVQPSTGYQVGAYWDTVVLTAVYAP